MAVMLVTQGATRKKIVPLREKNLSGRGISSGMRRNETEEVKQRRSVGQNKLEARRNSSPGPRLQICRRRIARLEMPSALFAALGRLLGRFFLGCFLGRGLGFLFRLLGRRLFRFLGWRFFLRRRFRCREWSLRSATRSGALGDDQFLFRFLFDHFFRVAAEFFFLKMHELVIVVLVFFFVGHLRSPFDSPLFRGMRWRCKPSRAYKRNPACLSSISPMDADSMQLAVVFAYGARHASSTAAETNDREPAHNIGTRRNKKQDGTSEPAES